MKRKVIFIIILSISLSMGCSKDKKVSIGPDSDNEALEELGYGKASYIGSTIEMLDNKNEVLKN